MKALCTMKYLILSLIFACFMLAGCSAKSSKSTYIFAGTEAVTDQDDHLPVDIYEIEQIFIDEYKNRDGSLQCVQQIVDRLADCGFIAIDSDNKVDMANAENMRPFIDSLGSGEPAKVSVLQVFYNGGLNLLEITADEGNVSVERTFYFFRDDHLSKTVHNEFEADYCEYTDEGYLLIGGSLYSPELYVLTMGEEEEHIALRVEPLDRQCRELNEKYMAPVSYNMNNMFITDWDEDDFAGLDFYDIFDRFYMETYGKDCPYTMSDDLSVGNEYDIPADEFENVIMQHIKVSPEELHMLLRYDDDKNIYIYRPRGFDEFDYVEVPYPEVTAFETNGDGSLTLTVNAVYPNDNTSKLFSHKVTVADENGKIYYRSNEILGDEEINLWWHADRLSDEEWNENYRGGADAEDDYSWMISQADHENFTEEEKKQIEEDTLQNAAEVWEYTKQPKISVLESLGELGVIATTNDADAQNGEKFNPFYDDYLNGKPGMITIYKVYDDGVIGSVTFLYRDEEIQSYYIGIKSGTDGGPCISEKVVQEIADIKYTPKGYFIYEYKDPMLHAGSHGYFRLSPMPDECRSLTDRFLKYLDFQKYKLMVCDWDEETVYNSPYPPFLEVTDYKYNADGTITLYADGVWPDYNSDHAFTNKIIVKPFKDGTFRILSNDVTEQELELPPVAYTK